MGVKIYMQVRLESQCSSRKLTCRIHEAAVIKGAKKIVCAFPRDNTGRMKNGAGASDRHATLSHHPPNDLNVCKYGIFILRHVVSNPVSCHEAVWLSRPASSLRRALIIAKLCLMLPNLKLSATQACDIRLQSINQSINQSIAPDPTYP